MLHVVPVDLVQRAMALLAISHAIIHDVVGVSRALDQLVICLRVSCDRQKRGERSR